MSLSRMQRLRCMLIRKRYALQVLRDDDDSAQLSVLRASILSTSLWGQHSGYRALSL